MLTALETRALAAIDPERIVLQLMELLRIPSVGGTEHEVEIQHLLAGRFAELDLAIDLWPLDLAELGALPDFPGVEVERDEAWGLVGTNVSGRTPALILQAHADVVPPGNEDQWTGDPFQPRLTWRDGDREIMGRGAADMKGGMVAIIAALQAIQAAGIDLPGGVALHSVVGEEDGGLGAFATLARGHRGDACIITEPTGGNLITANAGALTFRIEVTGLSAHGSSPHNGQSAFDAYLPVHAALMDLERDRNGIVEEPMAAYPIPYPLSVGRINAGDWSSSLPDLLVAEGRYGLRISEDPVAAVAEFEDAVAAAALRHPWLRDHPPVVTWPGGQFHGGRLPVHHPLADIVTAAHTDSGGHADLPRIGAPYGSDLRLYAAAGIPTLHYGPGTIDQAHGPDESVRLGELLEVTRTLVLTALRLAGPERSAAD